MLLVNDLHQYLHRKQLQDNPLISNAIEPPINPIPIIFIFIFNNYPDFYQLFLLFATIFEQTFQDLLKKRIPLLSGLDILFYPHLCHLP
jgi:hypothetical protein